MLVISDADFIFPYFLNIFRNYFSETYSLKFPTYNFFDRNGSGIPGAAFYYSIF